MNSLSLCLYLCAYMKMEKATTIVLAVFLISIFQTSKSSNDFAYMKSVYNATDLPLEASYDYIIIGGGTTGCPMAATLSEKYKVLVLERGSDPATYPQVLSLSGAFTSLTEEDDGKTPAQKFVTEDGVDMLRGRILGGSSMINFAFFSRAHEKFYEESGVRWDMKMVERAYEWVEETVAFHSDLGKWQHLFTDVLVEAGVGPFNGFSLDHLVGAKIGASTFDSVGRRHGAVEFLNKANLRNLKVGIHATVNKVLFSSSKFSGVSANGVEYMDSNGKIHRATVRGEGEVILSAGAMGSPQLLLLSGIGSKSYLSSMNIPVIVDHPHVAEFMADNPRNGIHLVVPFNLEPTYAQVAGITQENNIFESISYPLPYSIPNPPFGLFKRDSSSSSSSSSVLNLITIAEKFSDVESYGSLRLTSATDIEKSPTVRFNYFSNPNDLARCVRGVRKIGDMLSTPTMDKLKSKDFEGGRSFAYLGKSPPESQSDTAAVEEYCKETVNTFWHYHGGCVVGKVVDEDFRVIDVHGLRVIDGSTLLVSPGTNPQATLMMIGRYMGSKMLKERLEKSDENAEL